MKRRQFLQTGLGSVAAWMVSRQASGAWLDAEAAVEVSATYSNPVTFIEPEGAENLYADDFETDSELDPTAVFTLGVAAGDPRANGIVLWTRVDPAAIADPSHPAALGLEIATNLQFTAASVLIRATAKLSAQSDYTAKLPIAAPVLGAGQTYYYRFIYNQCASRTGRFNTLPAADSLPDSIQLAYLSCQDYSNGYYTALAHLADEDVDYLVFLGDYIYETVSDPSFQNQQVRSVPPLPSGASVAAGLEDYRHLYRVYRSDPNLQRLHERFAFIQIWDDHEFANDGWQDYHPDNNPTPDQPTPVLRQAATQAWVEYGLADVPYESTSSPIDAVRNYRSFAFGRLFDLIVTDQRLYRDGPPCGNDTTDRYFTQRCAAAESTARTMLGATQRDWLMNSLRDSEAVWKLWANEVTLMQMRVATQFVTLDQWDGFPAERASILSNAEQAGVKNLVAITGDIHSFIAGYLQTDYDLPTLPVGVELVVGSVSSANFQELVTSQVPLPNAPVPLPPYLPAGLGVEGALIASNPHMVYFNSSAHGYCLLKITPDTLVCTMKAVDTIRQPTGTSVRTLRQFLVEQDQIVLHTL